MARPPRDPQQPLLSGFLVWRIVFVSLLLVAGALGLFLFELQRGHSIDAARTAAVNALVLGQVFYLFSSRYLSAPVLNRKGLFGNPIAWVMVGVLAVLQALFTHWPIMHRLFGTAHMEVESWLLALAVGGAVFVCVEAEKALWRRFAPRRRAAARSARPT